jgi:hypothetical protein
MKKQILNPLCAITLLAACLPALSAADYQIVASKDIAANEISADDLRSVFLLSRTSLPGAGHVVPVLQKGGAAHRAFLRQCVGKSDTELQDTYKALVFTGKANAPKVLASDAAVIAFVSMSRGVIAYIGASAIPIGVKKLTVK